MRKFKLIKEYPGVFINAGDLIVDHNGIYFPENGGNGINPKCVENYPEFWEEVKDFPKIISFRKMREPMSGAIARLHSNGYYSTNSTVTDKFTLSDFLYGKASVEDGTFEIYQVAVSETEVFTLGDRVKYYGEVCNITGIYFNEHKQLSFRTNVKSLTVPKTGVFDLDVKYNKIKKAPEVLFVTEDCIEICEGDTVHWVSSNTCNYLYSTKFSEFHPAILKGETIFKIFSTKEAAEKYIDENKPIYSKKQIEDTLINTFIGTSSGIAIFAEIFKRNLGL